MGAFLALVTAIVMVVIVPTTDPGIKIKNTQENSITIQAFEKNSHRAELYAIGFCNKKGKEHKLNSEESRKFKFLDGLNNYKYDCVSQNTEATVTISSSNEEISAENTIEEISEPEKVVNNDCPSNTYESQEQADGSWETICKE